MGLLIVVSATASASINSWQVKLGLSGNTYPYGNDFSTRFGVDPEATWNYDSRDAVHPTVSDPVNDVAFIFSSQYYKDYQNNGGWPPADGRHGTGTLPSYPSPGLLKDMRAPILTDNTPEYWRVSLQAPRAGETVTFEWDLNSEAGFEVPANMSIIILANADLAAAGITGDLDLLKQGNGRHTVVGIPQFGFDEDNQVAIKHIWTIKANLGVVPEPGTIVLMAGGLIGMGGLIRRRK